MECVELVAILDVFWLLEIMPLRHILRFWLGGGGDHKPVGIWGAVGLGAGKNLISILRKWA